MRRRFATTGPRAKRSARALWDCIAWHYPLSRLAGDLCDQVEVAVVVHDGDALSLGDRGDQQVGEADRPDAPAAPQCSLHLLRSVPVLIVSGQPFITCISIRTYLIELGRRPSRPSKFELDHAAR